jgi:hypothetical protein
MERFFANGVFHFVQGVDQQAQVLEYLPGKIIEDALILAVEEEVRKERFSLGFHRHRDVTNEAYQRIYGDTQIALLRHFQREKHYPRLKSINFNELKESPTGCSSTA